MRGFLFPFLCERENGTTPIALGASHSNWSSSEPSARSKVKPNGWVKPVKKNKGKAKGAGKGAKGAKGKSSKGRNKMGCAFKTPKGAPICFGYSDANSKCKDSACTYSHVCGRCFGKHPTYACDNSGDTQGLGAELSE